MRRVTISACEWQKKNKKKKSVLVNVTMMLGAALKVFTAAMATMSSSPNWSYIFNIPGVGLVLDLLK